MRVGGVLLVPFSTFWAACSPACSRALINHPEHFTLRFTHSSLSVYVLCWRTSTVNTLQDVLWHCCYQSSTLHIHAHAGSCSLKQRSIKRSNYSMSPGIWQLEIVCIDKRYNKFNKEHTVCFLYSLSVLWIAYTMYYLRCVVTMRVACVTERTDSIARTIASICSPVCARVSVFVYFNVCTSNLYMHFSMYIHMVCTASRAFLLSRQ